MKALRIAGIASGLLGAVTAATVNAHTLEYTYQSDRLAWEATFINSDEWVDWPAPEESELPVFGFSYSISGESLASDLPTTFAINDGNVWLDPGFFGTYPRDVQSATSGTVSVNPDGSIASWYVLLQLTEVITPTTDDITQLSDYRIDISSAGGENTCNCDFFRNTFNIVGERRDTYFIVADFESNFSASNEISNWSANETSVPAPHSWSLMLAGLFSIYLLRFRRKINQTPDKAST